MVALQILPQKPQVQLIGPDRQGDADGLLQLGNAIEKGHAGLQFVGLGSDQVFLLGNNLR